MSEGTGFERVSGEKADLLYGFVDPDVISEDLGFDPTSLTPDQDTAVLSVMQSRAQFVVNGIAAELRTREHDILEKIVEKTVAIHGLKEEVEKLQETLVELRGTSVRFGDSVPDPEERTVHRERQFEQIARNRRYETALRLAKDESPFTLVLSERQGQRSLSAWVENFGYAIDEGYESKYNVRASATRAANCLDRIQIGTPTQLDWLAGRAAVAGYEVHASGTLVHVQDPVSFFGFMKDIPNFGPQSAIAVLCIADMQREQGLAEQVAATPKI